MNKYNYSGKKQLKQLINIKYLNRKLGMYVSKIC